MINPAGHPTRYITRPACVHGCRERPTFAARHRGAAWPSRLTPDLPNYLPLKRRWPLSPAFERRPRIYQKRPTPSRPDTAPKPEAGRSILWAEHSIWKVRPHFALPQGQLAICRPFLDPAPTEIQHKVAALGQPHARSAGRDAGAGWWLWRQGKSGQRPRRGPCAVAAARTGRPLQKCAMTLTTTLIVTGSVMISHRLLRPALTLRGRDQRRWISPITPAVAGKWPVLAVAESCDAARDMLNLETSADHPRTGCARHPKRHGIRGFWRASKGIVGEPAG